MHHCLVLVYSHVSSYHFRGLLRELLLTAQFTVLRRSLSLTWPASRRQAIDFTPGAQLRTTNRARQLYKNISMLFLFPVKDGKLSTGVIAIFNIYISFIRHKSQHQHSTQNKTEEKHTSKHSD